MKIEIKMEKDPSSVGTTRDHWVMPKTPREGYAKANEPDITGGIYIRRGTVVPNTIVLVLSEDLDEEVPAKKERKRSKKPA